MVDRGSDTNPVTSNVKVPQSCPSTPLKTLLAIEEPSKETLGEHRRTALHRAIDRRHELRPLRAERIERAGFDQRFNRRPAT